MEVSLKGRGRTDFSDVLLPFLGQMAPWVSRKPNVRTT